LSISYTREDERSKGKVQLNTNDDSYRWFNVPRWYLWEGGFLLIGRAQGVVPPHSHHAIQIVIALDGALAICGKNEEWRQGPGTL